MLSVRHLYASSCFRIAFLVACLIPIQPANAEVINFDTPADGAIINSFYPGVTFASDVGGQAGNAYARNAGGFAESQANVVFLAATGLTLFNLDQGSISASFGTPQSSVSIDAQTFLTVEPLGTINLPFMDVFDGSDNLLQRVLWPGTPTLGNLNYLTMAYDAGGATIAKIIFSVTTDKDVTVFGRFDNLTFDTATAVPVPAALPLFAGGLGLLGWMARRKRKAEQLA